MLNTCHRLSEEAASNTFIDEYSQERIDLGQNLQHVLWWNLTNNLPGFLVDDLHNHLLCIPMDLKMQALVEDFAASFK